MSCGLEMEKLKDFDKQLDEQITTLTNQIQQLEAQLTTAKNTYLKVLGAKELSTSLIKEATPTEDATAAVVPEASGD
jgi:outer membrane protein TolC